MSAAPRPPSSAPRRRRTPAATALALLAVGCGAATAGAPATGTVAPPVPRAATAGDTNGATMVPAGFGTLRQDDIAVRVRLVGGVTVRLIPLDEALIRLLSPDSYRTLHGLRVSQQTALDSVAQRFRYPRYSVWYVSFFGVEQGEARFSPFEVVVFNAGRDFRPLDVLPLTPGFGEQRLRQRETQSALYVFDGQLDVNQPLEVAVETTRDASWAGAVLPRVERERALVRSRAARGGSAPR